MKKRLRYVAPLQCGIVLGVFYLVLSVLFVPFILLPVLLRKGSSSPAIFGGAFVILIPLLYGAIGFIGGIIAAAFYNLVAKWTGGLEFEVAEAPPKLPDAAV